MLCISRIHYGRFRSFFASVLYGVLHYHLFIIKRLQRSFRMKFEKPFVFRSLRFPFSQGLWRLRCSECLLRAEDSVI